IDRVSLFYASGHNLDRHSFPTRRSSDLSGAAVTYNANVSNVLGEIAFHANSPFAIRGSRSRDPEQSAKVRHQVSSAGLKPGGGRSEEHTSELQSRGHLVCRLLLEKKTTT